MLAAAWACTGCASHAHVAKSAMPAPPVLPAQPQDAAAVAAQNNAVQAQLQQTQDDQILQAAQQAYASGLQKYQAGQYPAARAEFDRAVDLYLTSGRDLQADARLDQAFESTVDAINGLEMSALQQGNGFSQQEAAPVDVANDVTFPVDPAIKARAEAELKVTQSDLPLVVNDSVASFINYFSNTNSGHNTIRHSLERAGRYKAMISAILSQEGVPQDLIYLAVAESGFQPRAVNRRSGAGGMWQFMPYTNGYGLERNRWVDTRFDPIASTHAYARYIKDLHAEFGDWYLAMAAYDWGPLAVQRSVQRTGYADFWELYRRNVLPEETKNYVPIILAAAIMAKNPAQYGLSDLTPDPPLVMDTVTVHYSVDLRLVADVTGASVAELEDLNPSLLYMRTPPDEDFDLHLPVGTKSLYEQRIALIPEKHRDSWRYYTAGSGETLAGLAERFHVKAAEIASANHLSAHAAIAPDTALVIPLPPAPLPRPGRQRYRVRRGDTVITVADRFGITTTELRRWNRISGNRLVAGRTLYVSAPVLRLRRHRSLRRSRRSRGHASRTKARKQTAAQSAHGKSTASKSRRKPSSNSGA
jgi:membrane-bound lytic murein transglycosylase D